MSFPYNDQGQPNSPQGILAGVADVSAGQGLLRVSSLNPGSLAFSGDAANNRVSAVQQDAGNLQVSAKSGDGALFRISAIQGDAANLQVSSKSGDAALFRVSAIGGTAGDNVIVDGADQSVSARIKQISAVLSASDNALLAHIVSEGAHRARVSAIQGDGGLMRISALNQDANFMHVSGFSPDGALFRVSAILDNGSVSAKSGDAGQLRVSAILDSGSVSAKSADANQVHVSAVQGDAALAHVSAYSGDHSQILVSAKIVADARAAGGISLFSTSAGIAQVSTVKSSGGRLYGWYLGNPAGVDQYLQLFNASAGAQLGTDAPTLVFYVPTLGGANVLHDIGLNFSNGIQVGVTSTAGGNTAGASAMRVNLFYL